LFGPPGTTTFPTGPTQRGPGRRLGFAPLGERDDAFLPPPRAGPGGEGGRGTFPRPGLTLPARAFFSRGPRGGCWRGWGGGDKKVAGGGWGKLAPRSIYGVGGGGPVGGGCILLAGFGLGRGGGTAAAGWGRVGPGGETLFFPGSGLNRPRPAPRGEKPKWGAGGWVFWFSETPGGPQRRKFH